MAFPAELPKEFVRGLQAALVKPFTEENQGSQLLLPGDQGCDVLPHALTTTSLGCGAVAEELVCYKEHLVPALPCHSTSNPMSRRIVHWKKKVFRQGLENPM